MISKPIPSSLEDQSIDNEFSPHLCHFQAHLITKENVPKLEKMISERDAQIDFLTKNASSMEAEISRLKVWVHA